MGARKATVVEVEAVRSRIAWTSFILVCCVRCVYMITEALFTSSLLEFQLVATKRERAISVNLSDHMISYCKHTNFENNL